MLALSQLAGNKRFKLASKDWDRGRTTMHEALMNFCDAVNSILAPVLVKWPTGAEAQRCIAEMREYSGIPNCIGIIDGTHLEIRRPKRH